MPVAAFQTLTVWSSDPLTTCLPSGEYATEFTSLECPVSVHSCSWTKHGGQHQCTQQQTTGRSQSRTLTSLPVLLSQILTVLSHDPLTMCLPSGEYATECTGSECPLSVHSCSWTNLTRQHQCTQQQTIGR